MTPSITVFRWTLNCKIAPFAASRSNHCLVRAQGYAPSHGSGGFSRDVVTAPAFFPAKHPTQIKNMRYEEG